MRIMFIDVEELAGMKISNGKERDNILFFWISNNMNFDSSVIE